MGGERILILLDASASMLDETIVNVIRRRNLPDDLKRESDKWQRALRTVDWLTTQIPVASSFQIYTFNTEARPALTGTRRALAGRRRRRLAGAGGKCAAGAVVPANGTSLHKAGSRRQKLDPQPDNIYLIVDGLPTMGDKIVTSGKVSGRDRVRHIDRSLNVLPAGIPVNVSPVPDGGRPHGGLQLLALAQLTGGSFMSPSADWP